MKPNSNQIKPIQQILTKIFIKFFRAFYFTKSMQIFNKDNQKPESKNICIPDAEVAKTLCEQATYQSVNTEQFLDINQNLARKTPTPRRFA
jgi:hypothetical protein